MKGLDVLVWRVLRAALLAPLLWLACSASAQTLGFPTPVDVHVTPRGGKAVKVVSPQPGAADIAMPAMYYPASDKSRGAVVIVNAGEGWTDAREGQYARALRSAGYAVLAIDSYGPRGLSSTVADNARLAVQVQLRDALAARQFLLDQGHPADRVAIMGSGRGGTIALLAADRAFVHDEGDSFKLAIAIAPICIFHPKAPQPAARLFMALGDQDDVAGGNLCRDFASDFLRAGGQVELRAYRGASGDFDGHPKQVRQLRDPFVEVFSACRVPVDADGTAEMGERRFAERDYPALIAEMRKRCMGHGAISWTNLTQKANVTINVIEFLDLNFRR